MTNVIHSEIPWDRQYDLKGSRLGRRSLKKHDVNCLAPVDVIQKDLDLIEAGSNLVLESGARRGILRQLTRDTDFLSGLGVMDYSLLVGIRFRDQRESHWLWRLAGFPLTVFRMLPFRKRHQSFAGKPVIFRLGVIDFLQPYNTRKWLETHLKALYHDTKTVSCVAPTFYAWRFLRFIQSDLLGCAETA